MLTFNRKLALATGSVALLLAALSGLAAGLMARDRAENALVAQTVDDALRLLRQDNFRPEGPQATQHAHAAAQALAGGAFDIAQFYTTGGLLMAEQFSATGRALREDLPEPVKPTYALPHFERRTLPGQRQVLRVFQPLRSADQALTGYLEGARLMTPAQLDRLAHEARTAGLWTALAVLLCAGALYPLLLRLYADGQRRTRALLESHIAMMEALGRAIARSDSDSGAHNYRVALISATLAEAVGLHGVRMQELIAGSFLHDVGKIGIPDSILLKPGPLDADEMRVMRTHVGMGEDIVSGSGWLDGGKSVVAAHHEKWDGTGYPRGLAGEDIPLVARIFAIADVFDALCSRRPYKEPLPLAETLQALHREAGRHFDPHLVKVFGSLAGPLHHTLLDASEDEVRERLAHMVRKHFAL